MKRPWERGSRATVAGVLLPLVVATACLLAACGGSGGTASSSPSAATSPSGAPSYGTMPTPTPTPTVAGTIAFTKLDTPGDVFAGHIWVIKTDGSGLKRLTDGPVIEQLASWSPDGGRIVYESWRVRSMDTITIWTMNADGSGKVKLTPEGRGGGPVWSPDGKQILFWGLKAPLDGVCVMNSDGSGVQKVPGGDEVFGKVEVSEDGVPEGAGLGWTPDGKILFWKPFDVFAVDPDGTGLEQVTELGDVRMFSMAPDGTAIAVQREESRVDVVPLQGGGAPVPILALWDWTSDLFACPSWSADGGALVVSASSTWGMTGSPLLVVNPDGSGLSAVPGIETALDPEWRPE